MGEMNARRAMVEFVMQERCDGVVFDSEKSGLDGEAVSGFEKVVSGSLFREVCFGKFAVPSEALPWLWIAEEAYRKLGLGRGR